MSTLLGSLTALFILSIYFVAYKNKVAYDGKLESSDSLKSALVKSESRLKDAEEALTNLPSEVIAAEAEIERLTAAEVTSKQSYEDLKSKIETLAVKLATGKTELESLKKQKDQSSDIAGLSAKFRAGREELEEVSQSLAVEESKLANLTAQNASSETRAIEGKANLEKFTAGQSLPALKTRIRNIYPNWGFVTLASGNNSGVIANSTLDVVRDGQVIAKLLVTAVESTTSSASIIPDSMSTDITLNVGDRVVPGQKLEMKPTAN